MTIDPARLQARAALFAAPSTLVSEDEVAWVMRMGKTTVHEHRPETARPLRKGCRVIYATWADWMSALDTGAPRAAPKHHEPQATDDLMALGYRPNGGALKGRK